MLRKATIMVVIVGFWILSVGHELGAELLPRLAPVPAPRVPQVMLSPRTSGVWWTANWNAPLRSAPHVSDHP